MTPTAQTALLLANGFQDGHVYDLSEDGESVRDVTTSRSATMRMPFKKNDGGRAAAGYQGSVGDCTVRAIAIATGKPYQEVYDDLFELNRNSRWRSPSGKRSPRDGNTNMKTIRAYMESLGWRWVPRMKIGSGCTTHLAADELPAGRLVVRLSRHLCAVIDGVINDTFDPQRSTLICENGVQRIAERCVYGWFEERRDT